MPQTQSPSQNLTERTGTMIEFPHEGRTCIITGSTGIGAATARALAARRYRLMIVGKNEEHCSTISQELSSLTEARYHVGDLRDPATSQAVVDEVTKLWGRLDALFNVAGGSGRSYGDGPVDACTESGWDQTFASNADLTYKMTHAALSRMLGQEIDAHRMRGTVLNMSSVLAYAPQRTHFTTHAYAASKAAVLGLSVAMAGYYAPFKINVNVISPGLVQTNMARRASEDPRIRELMKTKQPLAEGLIQPEDCANLAAFLLSPEARMITGQTIGIDAGWAVSESQLNNPTTA